MAKPLRNITKDLEARLKKLLIEKDDLMNEIDALERVINSCNVILEHERRRATEQLRLPIQAESKHQMSGNIVRLVRGILSDQRERNLSDIAEAVKIGGANFGNKNPNRVVHFALVGMKRHGLVEIVSTGVWKATPKLLEQTKSESKTGETPNITS
jgi:hypothetical protein